MAEYVIAKYIRLSIEDTQSDSLSVETQRLILDRHIEDMEIPDATILEFIDNGHSGTSFDRPAVQELLELVRLGRINCVIVKDLSRLGRNMLETGYYIERVFPLYGVRFIAVSDGLDSAEHNGGLGGMEVAFKFLAHEQYSRDLSRKIKTAKLAKALRGEYVVPKFGYKKVGNRLEIDEPAAETVRLIFEMYIADGSITSIAARLYAEKRPTPSEYRKSVDNPVFIWGKSAILGILRDEQYIGAYIAGKTKCLDVGGKFVPVPESEWIKIPNHHPAIIDKAVFEVVQAKIGYKRKPTRKATQSTITRYVVPQNPLKGKVVCGCCGHVMRISVTKNSSFLCQYTQVATDAECHKLRMLGSEVEAIVLERVREQARLILDTDPASPTLQTEHDAQVTQAGDAKCALYERYVLGEVSVDEYLEKKVALDANLERTKFARSAYVQESATKESYEKLRQIAEDAVYATELTRSVVDALVDKVRIYPGSRVEVAWVM